MIISHCSFLMASFSSSWCRLRIPNKQARRGFSSYIIFWYLKKNGRNLKKKVGALFWSRSMKIYSECYCAFHVIHKDHPALHCALHPTAFDAWIPQSWWVYHRPDSFHKILSFTSYDFFLSSTLSCSSCRIIIPLFRGCDVIPIFLCAARWAHSLKHFNLKTAEKCFYPNNKARSALTHLKVCTPINNKNESHDESLFFPPDSSSV